MSNGNDASGISNFQLYESINRLRRDMESMVSDVRGDARAIRQTVDEKVVPRLEEHDKELDLLRSRFVYALTIIGSAIGAVMWFLFKGGSPIG